MEKYTPNAEESACGQDNDCFGFSDLSENMRQLTVWSLKIV